VTEIVSVKGPLDDERLSWITTLYGPVDEKYASIDFVRHQFVGNPFGWSTHTFVMDGERAAGHCSAIPFRARYGADEIVAGKIEAVVLAEDQRGRRTEDGRSLAVAMLSAMYEAAHDHGTPLLFGLAPPNVASVHARAGCKRLRLTATTYVHISSPRRIDTPQVRRRVAVNALAAAQRLLLSLRSSGRPHVEEPTAEDAASVEAAPPPDGAWTISGADSWDWFAGCGLLRAVEIGGARAIVRLADVAGADVQIVAWRPGPQPQRSAMRLLAALALLSRRRGARTLRFQPWVGTGGDGVMAQACRRAGFVRRSETELVLHSRRPELMVADVQLTPFFYVTF
jgi:hypothetical protein